MPRLLGTSESDIATVIEILASYEVVLASYLVMSSSAWKACTRAYLDAETDAGREKRLARMVGRLKEIRNRCELLAAFEWVGDVRSMVILITGASHTGKTLLAQKLMERYRYPVLSLDLLKMGLMAAMSSDSRM